MTSASPVIQALKKPATLIGAAVLVVVVVVWLVVFFFPQGSKLSSLQTKESSLRQAVIRGDAKIQQLRRESSHTTQILAMYNSLSAYVPSTEDLYTYIQTLSGAANSAGVAISSVQPGTLATVSGSSYSALPITLQVAGTYDHLLAFLHALYALPRLTDVNSFTVSGGAGRSSPLNVTFDLSIFTSTKPG